MIMIISLRAPSRDNPSRYVRSLVLFLLRARTPPLSMRGCDADLRFVARIETGRSSNDVARIYFSIKVYRIDHGLTHLGFL